MGAEALWGADAVEQHGECAVFQALADHPGVKPRLQNTLAQGSMDSHRLDLPVTLGVRVDWDGDLLSLGATLPGPSCPEQPLWIQDSI